MDASQAPELIVLPGLDGSASLRREFVALAGRRMSVRVIDYAAAPGQDYASLSDWLAPQMPQHRLFVLLGESFGGPLALMIAARRPTGLIAVVLVASFTRAPLRLAPARLAGVLGSLTRWIPSAAIGWGLLNLRASDQVSELAGVVRQLRPDLLRERLQAVLQVDVRTHASKLEVPLLVLEASVDRMLLGVGNDWPARAQVQQLPGPHSLLQACPHAVTQTVTAFLSSLARFA
jgi:pimeloyl-ACP methyl ester carboxylesterase